MLRKAIVRERAYIREDPKIESMTIGIAPLGAVVMLLDSDCGWSLIEYQKCEQFPKVVGWVRNECLLLLREPQEPECKLPLHKIMAATALAAVGLVISVLRKKLE